MPNAVEAAIAELEAALAEALPVQEGLVDYSALNLKQPAKNDVAALKAQVDRRVMKIRAALEACNGLVSDGYPELPTRSVEAAVLADLADQQATISAALSKFAPAQANDIGLVAGAPEPK